MTGTYTELVLVSLAAMVSPTTLTFSVLALVLGDRPLRTGLFFLCGCLTATLAVGVAAAFVLGDAASHTSTPKTWVSIVDIVAGVPALAYRRDAATGPILEDSWDGRAHGKIASSPAIAIVGAGAGEPGVHPDRAEGHTRSESDRGPIRRRVALSSHCVITAARRRSCLLAVARD